MKAFINKNINTLREVFDPESINRMKTIADEFSKLESAAKVKGDIVDIDLQDLPSNFLKMAGRISGATFGRWFGGLTGGGTIQVPAIFSERFKNFATHLTKDRAFQMIHDAVVSEDRRMLQALLLPIDKPTSTQGLKNLRLLNERMNLWLLGTGGRVLNDIKDEIVEDVDQGNIPETLGP
jgi:hypothetical protein